MTKTEARERVWAAIGNWAEADTNNRWPECEAVDAALDALLVSVEVEQQRIEEKALGAELAAVVNDTGSSTTETASVYLVFGESGEYDDWRNWVVNAWPSSEAAHAEVARLAAIQAEWRDKYKAIRDTRDEDDDWLEQLDRCRDAAPTGVDPTDDVLFSVDCVPFMQVGHVHSISTAKHEDHR